VLNQDFQYKLAKLVCTDVKFAQQYASLIKREYFDSQQLRNIFDLVKDYIINYEKELDRSTCLQLIDEHCEDKGFSSEVNKDYFEHAKRIFKQTVKNKQFIEDKFLEFAKEQELKNAFLEGIKIMEEGQNYEEVRNLVERALSVGVNVDSGYGIEDMYYLPSELRRKLDPKVLIPTGIAEFDKAMQGGMAPGEVHVIQARPKLGKSTFGCNVGAYNIINDRVVFHISLEISAQDVLYKYACRLIKTSYQGLLDLSDEEYKNRVKRWEMRKNNLFINYWTQQTITTEAVKSWIARQRALTDKNPDLIIIDYDDLLRPTIAGRFRDMYEDAGQIYNDLKRLADYFDCPVLTFAQPQRQAWNKYDDSENFTMADDLAHSAKKAHNAFSISSLNFKKGNNKGVLYIDMNRRGQSERKIPIARNLDHALFEDDREEKQNAGTAPAVESQSPVNQNQETK